MTVEPRRRPQMKVTSKRRLAVYAKSNFRCRQCGWAPPVPKGYDGRYALVESFQDFRTQRIKIRVLEIDHIHPRRFGGTNALENLQALCNGCNVRKGAKV